MSPREVEEYLTVFRNQGVASGKVAFNGCELVFVFEPIPPVLPTNPTTEQMAWPEPTELKSPLELDREFEP